MTASIMPAYYLMIIGGSLTITGSINLVRGPYVSTGVIDSYLFLIPLLLGIAIIYFGQQFYRKNGARFTRAAEVAAISIIATFFLPGVGVYYFDLFFAGPPISFAGGILGALLSRGTEQVSTPPT